MFDKTKKTPVEILDVDLVSGLVKKLAVEGAEVEKIEVGRIGIFKITVPTEMMGRILGKGGRTITALRTIVAGMGGAQNQKYILEIIDAETQESF